MNKLEKLLGGLFAVGMTVTLAGFTTNYYVGQNDKMEYLTTGLVSAGVALMVSSLFEMRYSRK